MFNLLNSIKEYHLLQWRKKKKRISFCYTHYVWNRMCCCLHTLVLECKSDLTILSCSIHHHHSVATSIWPPPSQTYTFSRWGNSCTSLANFSFNLHKYGDYWTYVYCNWTNCFLYFFLLRDLEYKHRSSLDSGEKKSSKFYHNIKMFILDIKDLYFIYSNLNLSTLSS